MSSHVGQFACLAYVVTFMDPLQVVVFLCTLLHRTVQSTVVQCLYFRPEMSKNKHKSSSDVAGIILYLPRQCPIRLKMFSVSLYLFFMYYLCKKYYKPITVQYYMHAQLLTRIWLLCHCMDCNPPDSFVQGISQARIMKWVAISFFRESC